jgi:hypothetical protein
VSEQIVNGEAKIISVAEESPSLKYSGCAVNIVKPGAPINRAVKKVYASDVGAYKQLGKITRSV